MAAQQMARSSAAQRDGREDAVLGLIASSGLIGETSKRFESDTRAALRRCRDGPAATPCSDWSKACPKCKTHREGAQHHIFCDVRLTYKTKAEIEVARALREAILKYHCLIAWWTLSHSGTVEHLLTVTM